MIGMKIEYDEVTKNIFIQMDDPVPLDEFKDAFNKICCDYSLDMIIDDEFVLTGEHAKKFREQLEHPKPLTEKEKEFMKDAIEFTKKMDEKRNLYIEEKKCRDVG